MPLFVKPHGIFCAHWWDEIGCLLNITRNNEIRLFVEIGILDGGLTALLIDECSWGSLQYIGIDLREQIGTYTDARVVRKIAYPDQWGIPAGRMELYRESAWDEKTVQYIAGRLRDFSGGRAMVYCDGGDKKKEAALYWPVLRSGDFLGVHDYSDDPTATGPEVYPIDMADILVVGKRRFMDILADTRILLVEKT